MLDAASLKRFWEKVAIGTPDECWPWLGARLPKGYGRVKVNGRATLTHRVAYFIANPTSRMKYARRLILHSCDNPPCCNPKHLRLGTFRDNRLDLKVRKGLPRRGKSVDLKPAATTGHIPWRKLKAKQAVGGAAGGD